LSFRNCCGNCRHCTIFGHHDRLSANRTTLPFFPGLEDSMFAPAGWEGDRCMSFKYRIVICHSKIDWNPAGEIAAQGLTTRLSCKAVSRKGSNLRSFAFIAQLEAMKHGRFELNPLLIPAGIILALNSLYLCINLYFTGLYLVIKDPNSGCSEINIPNVKKTFSICDVFVNALIIAVFRKINLHFFIKSPTLKAQYYFSK
jgi:hypothetical protein